MKIQVMSYNTQHCLNFLTRKIDYAIMADTIRNCGADIIGLQEMRDECAQAGYEAQAKILAEKLGYHFYFAEAIRFNGENPYGNALLSRYPITAAQTIPIPDPAVKKYDGYYETRCLLKAHIAVGGGLDVLVGHFGLNPDEHENAVATVVANLPEERCVLMGDFNMEPENPLLVPIRQRLDDTARLFDGPRLSWPSDAPTVKIDYIFVSPDITVHAADIPAIVSSDHRPHTAAIEA